MAGKQEQCPNCGGYKGTTTTKAQPTKIVGTENLSTGYIIMVWVTFIVCVAFFGLGLLLLLDRQSRMQLFSGKKYKRSELRYHYFYTCEICGNKWDWLDNGMPKPQITVVPNEELIRKGNQRLEELARQRQRDMEAAWWLQQQQKNDDG